MHCGAPVPRNESRTASNVHKSTGNASHTASAAGSSPKKTRKRGFFASLFRILLGIIISAVVFALVIVVCDKIDEQKAQELHERYRATRPTEPTLSSEEAALIERLPDVPTHLLSVQALNHRGMGSCKELTGNVAVTVVFVDDAVSSWTQEKIDSFTADLYAGFADLTGHAAQWSVPLNLTLHTSHSTLDYELEPEVASRNLNVILSRAGYDLYGLNESLKQELQADAVPFVIAFNKEGRSYAGQDPDEENVQACYLFSGSYAFKHELLHLFGASDFYYHDLMDFGAMDILEGSIMADSTNDKVDDLTAYLVGWTDQLTSEAEAMLYLIGYIGNEELQAAAQQNVFTGFGTTTYDDGSSYTGYLTMGVPDGWGEMLFPGGEIYRGEFDNGAITGYGCFIWTNGNRYEGYFLAGQLHGDGTMTCANGDVFSGTWDNSTYLG